jgi:hypothetical protein
MWLPLNAKIKRMAAADAYKVPVLCIMSTQP